MGNDESMFQKFVTLIIDELHAVEDRLSTRIDKVEKDVAEIKDELRAIRLELRDINRRLDTLEERVGWMTGYAKEIDDLRSRVKALEISVQQHPSATNKGLTDRQIT